MKGTAEGRLAWFLVVASGSCAPSWKTITPGQFLVDEEWVAFLKRDGDIYYPLGGVNGLLQLRGQEVIYDRKVKHRYNKSYLVREVLRSVDD
jgi:hypothetical protein